MNKTEIKAALIESGNEAKQNRKDYLAGRPHKYDYDYRDRDLRRQARALHIALAYLNGKPFKSCERYNYKTDETPKMTASVRAERMFEQFMAVHRAVSILGFTETLTIAGKTVTRPARSEEFENWVLGIQPIADQQAA